MKTIVCSVFLLTKTFDELLVKYEGQKYRVVDAKGNIIVGGVMDPTDGSILDKEMLSVFKGEKGGLE